MRINHSLDYPDIRAKKVSFFKLALSEFPFIADGENGLAQSLKIYICSNPVLTLPEIYRK